MAFTSEKCAVSLKEDLALENVESWSAVVGAQAQKGTPVNRTGESTESKGNGEL